MINHCNNNTIINTRFQNTQLTGKNCHEGERSDIIPQLSDKERFSPSECLKLLSDGCCYLFHIIAYHSRPRGQEIPKDHWLNEVYDCMMRGTLALSEPS